MAELIKVAEVGEVSPGEGKVVVVKGMEVVLLNVDGKIYALDNICPHAAFALGEGTVEGDIIICPGHALEYKIPTGECLTDWGKDEGIESVDSYPVVVEGNDIKISF